MRARRWLLIAAPAGLLALAVGLIAGREVASGLFSSAGAPASGSPVEPPVPPGFVAFRDAEAGFSVAYPSGWERREAKSTDVGLIAASGNGASLLVRASDLGFEVPRDRVGVARDLTDRFVSSGRGVRLLAEPRRIELDGLPGYSYLYSFSNSTSGRRGIHLHYFLFDGRRMITLVMQALPASALARAAPTFDAIAASFRVE